MRPLRIYLENFMNHSKSEIDCSQFRSALIVGKSKKNEFISNGVGKTTIFNAIEYALFNESHSTTLPRIIKDGEKKVIVEYDFQINNDIYRIYRSRTSSGTPDLRLYKKDNDNWTDLSERTPTATDEVLKKLIKISHKSFTYSVLFRQADLTGITNAKEPETRREILKEPLNLALYSKLEKIANEKTKPIKKEIERLETSITVVGNPDEDIKKAKEELKTIIENIESQKVLIKNTETTIESKKNTVEDLKRSLSSEDADIHKRVAEKESEQKKLNDSLKNDNKKLLSLNDLLLKREGELKTLESNLVKAQDKLTELSSVKIEQTQYDELSDKLKKVSNDELVGLQMLATVKANINHTKLTLPDSDNCPSCKQSITSEYRSKIETDISNSLVKLNDELLTLEDNLGKCRRKKQKLDDELKTAKNNINEFSKLESQIKSINNEVKSKREDIDRLYIDQKDLNKNIQDFEQQIIEVTNSLESLKEAAGKSNAPAINNQIFAINKEISEQKANLSSYTNRISSLSSIQGGLEERIATRTVDKEKLIDYKNSLVKNRRELKIRQMVVDAFSTKGIPTLIIQNVIDDLQFESNKALKELRPELDVQIDADLNFVYRRNGEIREYSQMSHGQHVYIALAFKRAMARVIQSKLGITLEMLIFDEVDSPLDEAGVSAFADCINKWQKDFVIFVITHNKDLKEKFSHVIVVEEGDNGSEATLSNNW